MWRVTVTSRTATPNMGFFALLEHADGGAYEVTGCHINIWSLSGLPWHRPMLLDVGVMMKAKTPVTALKLAVPIDFGQATDLADMVQNTDEASLIFGKDFIGTGHEHLELKGRGNLRILPVNPVVNEDRRAGEPGLSVLTIKLTRRLDADEQGYARVRLSADGAGEMWRWRRVLTRRNGALIDFRSPEPREGKGHRSDLSEQAVPLEGLNIFVMLPDRFQLRVANPKLEYIRTLEGAQWRSYLRRRASRFSRDRIMVYRWKVPLARFDDPFRGVMQLTREPSFRPLTDHLVSSGLVAAVLFALFRPLSLRHGVEDVGGGVVDAIPAGWAALVGALGVTGIARFALKFTRVRQQARKAKRWVKHNIEYPFFK